MSVEIIGNPHRRSICDVCQNIFNRILVLIPAIAFIIFISGMAQAFEDDFSTDKEGWISMPPGSIARDSSENNVHWQVSRSSDQRMYHAIDPLNSDFKMSLDAVIDSASNNCHIDMGLLGDINDLSKNNLYLRIGYYGGGTPYHHWYACVTGKYNDGTAFTSLTGEVTPAHDTLAGYAPINQGQWYSYELEKTGSTWHLSVFDKNTMNLVKSFTGTLSGTFSPFNYVYFGNSDRNDWPSANGKLDNLEIGMDDYYSAFEDDFSDSSLSKWVRYGSPSPQVLGSAEGRNGVFDNNGDGWCDSGIVSREAFSLPNGFTLESDIFMDITNPGSVFADAMFGLLKSEPAIECNVQHGLVFRFSWDWGIHAQTNGGFYTESGTWEGFQQDLTDSDYVDGWHKFKVVVQQDRYVKYYLDDSLIYASINKIDPTLLEGKKLIVNGRSAGYPNAGKVYHDYIALSSEQHTNQDVIFKTVDLVPATGTTVLANNEAYVLLKVENKGIENIPPSDWNINLYFNDLWGTGSDLVETLVTHQTTKVQERNLQFSFPEIPPGETTIQIPILLNMRDPIFHKDQYMAYADQLIVCGNPLPQEVDCTNSNHLAANQVYIASNIRGDSVGCVWGVFNLAVGYVVDMALDAFEWLPECPGVEQFFENLGLFVGQVLQDCATQEPDVPQYIRHCFDQLFALAQSCKELPGIERVIMIFDFIEEVYDVIDTAGECLSMINSWMAELTEINNLMGDLYQMIIINNGSDVVLTNSAGQEIRIIGESITNEIPQSRAFLIPQGEVILVAGNDDLKLQITSTNSSSMEILCIGPKEPNNCSNERFVIDASPGTKLATTYSSGTGYLPISIDYEGDGTIDYYSYPDTWKNMDVDIKPGGCPNPINPKSNGVIPVAILGNEEFDVDAIDTDTIMLGKEGINGGVRPIKYDFEDVSSPFTGRLCNCHSLGADGYMDMILHFDAQQVATELRLTEETRSSIPLKITCNLKGDTITLVGQDCAKINVKPKETTSLLEPAPNSIEYINPEYTNLGVQADHKSLVQKVQRIRESALRKAQRIQS